MSRESLHELINRIPETDLTAAEKYLQFLASSAASRAALSAKPDEEPVTEGDAAAVRRALDDLRAGRVTSHEDVLREFDIK
jgi:3'-phosphoadenosine 5'-phosphosulfate (PAPS) 3'-phosphatase